MKYLTGLAMNHSSLTYKIIHCAVNKSKLINSTLITIKTNSNILKLHTVFLDSNKLILVPQKTVQKIT